MHHDHDGRGGCPVLSRGTRTGSIELLFSSAQPNLFYCSLSHFNTSVGEGYLTIVPQGESGVKWRENFEEGTQGTAFYDRPHLAPF